MSAVLDDAFFRRESARLVAALTRIFGVSNLALAEDVTQDVLARAFESWRFTGVPPHAAALLMVAAKNRAIDVLRRARTAREHAPELARTLENEWTGRPTIDEELQQGALHDDELRMMFTCCHPRLGEDVQVALVLHVLCGFGAREAASAFLVSEAAMEKRLSRAKRTLAESRRLFELDAEDFAERLSAVQRAIYLLFSEGYHGSCAEAVIRAELCRDALRLVRLLLEHPASATPATHALAALLHLGAARLPARIDDAGDLHGLFEQDRSRWDGALLAEGMRLLDASACGDALTEYHLEAGIAGLHASAARAEDTPWADIVSLYDVLMRIRPSPMIALSRAIAIAELEGPARGLEAIRAIADDDRLAPYPFHAAAVAELELRSGHPDLARAAFTTARRLARNDAERRFLDRRIAACDAPSAR